MLWHGASPSYLFQFGFYLESEIPGCGEKYASVLEFKPSKQLRQGQEKMRPYRFTNNPSVQPALCFDTAISGHRSKSQQPRRGRS